VRPSPASATRISGLRWNSAYTDALIQVGTNLSMVQLAAAAEMWHGKPPVVAINTATYWHALRQNNIKDKIAGLGRLLAPLTAHAILAQRVISLTHGNSVAVALKNSEADFRFWHKADIALMPRALDVGS
jgi:hypothetical protein